MYNINNIIIKYKNLTFQPFLLVSDLFSVFLLFAPYLPCLLSIFI